MKLKYPSDSTFQTANVYMKMIEDLVNYSWQDVEEYDDLTTSEQKIVSKEMFEKFFE